MIPQNHPLDSLKTPIFVLGLLVSFLLWRTGSLWTCIFAHMTVNAVTVFMAVLFGLVLR